MQMKIGVRSNRTLYRRVNLSHMILFLGGCCIWLNAGWSESASGQEIRLIREVSQESDQNIDQLLQMEKITELQTNIHNEKISPVDRYAKIDTGPFIHRSFYPKAVLWEAPNICYNPLYFQDVGAERYGQDACLLQPVLSGAHFFGRTVALPLHAMVRCPFSCDYPLGHYRPGNCNPYLHYSFPW